MGRYPNNTEVLQVLLQGQDDPYSAVGSGEGRELSPESKM